MSRILYILIIVSLVSCKEKTSKSISDANIYKEEANYLSYVLEQSLLENGKGINDINLYRALDSIPLKELVSTENVHVIIYIPLASCTACNCKLISHIEDYIVNNNVNLIIISKDINVRECRVIYGEKAYVSKESIANFEAIVSYPIVFVVNPDLKITKYFIPSLEFIAFLDKYLDIIVL